MFSKLSYSSIFSGNSFSFCSKISIGSPSILSGKSFSSRSKGISIGPLNSTSSLL
jgi:hypothetical protein